MVLQCIGVLAKSQNVQQVMAWASSHDLKMLGAAETFVHVLGSMPDTRLRLDVLRLYHYFEEDMPKKVRYGIRTVL